MILFLQEQQKVNVCWYYIIVVVIASCTEMLYEKNIGAKANRDLF